MRRGTPFFIATLVSLSCAHAPAPTEVNCPAGTALKQHGSADEVERWCVDDAGRLQGFRELRYDNRRVLFARMEDGRRHGVFETWFAMSGKPASHGAFRHDKEHGEWTFYWPNGVIKEKGCYIDGAKVGRWLITSEKGTSTSVDYPGDAEACRSSADGAGRVSAMPSPSSSPQP